MLSPDDILDPAGGEEWFIDVYDVDPRNKSYQLFPRVWNATQYIS